MSFTSGISTLGFIGGGNMAEAITGDLVATARAHGRVMTEKSWDNTTSVTVTSSPTCE
jgi:pyrroline-5-carboxylate reductase